MDRIYKCDRCGKAVSIEPESISFKTKNGDQYYGVVLTGCSDEVDVKKDYVFEYWETPLRLCESCQKDLVGFLSACNSPTKEPQSCPFCGKHPYAYSQHKKGTNYYGIVECVNCDFYITGRVCSTADDAINEVIRHWNSKLRSIDRGCKCHQCKNFEEKEEGGGDKCGCDI